MTLGQYETYHEERGGILENTGYHKGFLISVVLLLNSATIGGNTGQINGSSPVHLTSKILPRIRL